MMFRFLGEGGQSFILGIYICVIYNNIYIYAHIFLHMSTCQCIVHYIRIYTFIHRCVRCKAVRIPIMG